jgi:hypothetical protein
MATARIDDGFAEYLPVTDSNLFAHKDLRRKSNVQCTVVAASATLWMWKPPGIRDV